jgi:hypothetical protein
MHLFTIKDIKDLASNQFEWERNFRNGWGKADIPKCRDFEKREHGRVCFRVPDEPAP